MKSDGFTLIELIVAVAILSILVSIAVMAGSSSMMSYQVEKQTKDMYSDFMKARVSAMQRNRVFFVTLSPNQYTVYEDTNPSPDGDGHLQASLDTTAVQKTVTYTLDSGGTTSFSFIPNGLVADVTGVVSDATYTIHTVPSGSSKFDCIILSGTRLIMGKYGTDCVAQ